MKVLCKYYSDNFRLLDGFKKFSESNGFRFFCSRGTVWKQDNEYKIIASKAVTIIVTATSDTTKKNLIAVLTSDIKYKDSDCKYVDLAEIEHDNVNVAICNILRDKYKNTLNIFSLELGGNGSTVIVSIDPETEDFTCKVKSSGNEIIGCGYDFMVQYVQMCNLLKSFSYTIANEKYEKGVTINRNRGEILREIAHYCNKTIVVVCSSKKGEEIIEQYISATSALEVKTRSDLVKSFKKIGPSELKNLEPFCLYLMSQSVEDIAKNISKDLSRKDRRYKC